MYMEGHHIKQPFYYQSPSLCALELKERSNWKGMAADTHQSFSDTTL